MVRCISVDPLGFHNFMIGQDSIIIKYNDLKADKDGERILQKKTYANTDHYYPCFWTSLGIWCALDTENMLAHEEFFLGVDSKEGSAGGRYQDQLLSLIAHHKEEVENDICINHMHVYVLRKVSATLALSGTTNTPPISSVAKQGE